MSVSSVKNLNGNEFSAVKDTSLTEFVQTNSASWVQGGGDSSNIFYIIKEVTPFSEAVSAAREGKTLIAITSGGGSIGTVVVSDITGNYPYMNICLFGDAGYQGKGGGGEKQWYSKCQLYTFSNSTGPGWYTEGGWYNEGHPQSDWNNTNGNSPSFIRNKPVLSAYAYTSAVDNKLDTSSFSDVSSTFLTGVNLSSLNDAGVNNIVLTASLPGSPDVNTLYLIPEA